MNSITEEINEALAEHHMKYGVSASRIYLGKHEYKRFICFLLHANRKANEDILRDDVQYMACKVYQVIVDSHCFAC